MKTSLREVDLEQFKKLNELMPEADVQHVGSTAVSRILTKGDILM